MILDEREGETKDIFRRQNNQDLVVAEMRQEGEGRRHDTQVSGWGYGSDAC